jgi:hypothetical protein
MPRLDEMAAASDPEYAVGFVARVESAMAARVSLRRNSPSHPDERKASETLAAAVISDRSRNPIAYSGSDQAMSSAGWNKS